MKLLNVSDEIVQSDAQTKVAITLMPSSKEDNGASRHRYILAAFAVLFARVLRLNAASMR